MMRKNIKKAVVLLFIVLICFAVSAYIKSNEKKSFNEKIKNIISCDGGLTKSEAEDKKIEVSLKDVSGLSQDEKAKDNFLGAVMITNYQSGKMKFLTFRIGKTGNDIIYLSYKNMLDKNDPYHKVSSACLSK